MHDTLQSLSEREKETLRLLASGGFAAFVKINAAMANDSMMTSPPIHQTNDWDW